MEEIDKLYRIRRDKIELYTAMLNKLIESDFGCIKTDFLYIVRSNYGMINEYLHRLKGFELIYTNDDWKRFFITDKGITFLQKYEELMNIAKIY